MDNIAKTLKQIIQSFKELLSGHPNYIYQDLLNLYETVLADYQQNKDAERVKSEIRWTDRTITEAPPYDRNLGLQLLEQITQLYSYLPK